MIKDTSMLSRVVDSLYWMSRYLERAEHTSRFLDVHLNLMLDVAPGTIEKQRMKRLLQSLAPKSEDEEFENDLELIRWLTFEVENKVSIYHNITSARENARQVREQISSEMWTQINKLYLHVRQTNQSSFESSPHDFYLEVKEGVHLFQGITDATMNHNQGWHFIQIGRYIERIIRLMQLLEVHFDNESLIAQYTISTNYYFEMVAILKSVSAFEAYCKVYNPNLQSANIIEFLLFNKEFPRSLHFCVDMILVSLHALGDATMRNKNTRLYRTAGRLQSQLSYDDMTDIVSLSEYTQSIKQQVYQIHDMLYDTFITYQIETAL